MWLPSVLSVYFASIGTSSLLLFQRYSDAMLVVARHLLYADFFSGCLGADGGLSENRAKSVDERHTQSTVTLPRIKARYF